ncbi:MAG: hypothetical protein NT062_32855 [Proteobacteria bacterium]|nr:hypothetical protein [Pseudomonadota bacterium]
MLGGAGMLALGLVCCITIPPYQGVPEDASDGVVDTNPGLTPLARLIGNAYRDQDMSGQGTVMMTYDGYGISTAGIAAGDLVLFIANIDNGNDKIWSLPFGFTQLAQHFYGADGQTYFAAWKIATAGEPTFYAGTYDKTTGVTSAAATISLIAISGADPDAPIDPASGVLRTDSSLATSPVDVSSSGVVATVDHSLIVMAAGADWTPYDGTNTFEPPTGFTTLTQIADENTHWHWTSQAIATKAQAAKGPTGPLTATLTGHPFAAPSMAGPGAGWSVVIAVAPPHAP